MTPAPKPLAAATRRTLTCSGCGRVVPHIEKFDLPVPANHSSEGPLMSRSIPTDTAILWATLEVARQLMIANELAMPNAKCDDPREASEEE